MTKRRKPPAEPVSPCVAPPVPDTTTPLAENLYAGIYARCATAEADVDYLRRACADLLLRCGRMAETLEEVLGVLVVEEAVTPTKVGAWCKQRIDEALLLVSHPDELDGDEQLLRERLLADLIITPAEMAAAGWRCPQCTSALCEEP